MGLLSWFRGSKATDYETVLAQLASEISEAKQNLSEIRLRERRFRLLLNAYGVGLWAIWVGLWWFGGVPWGLIGWDAEQLEARIIGGGCVIAGPILIWFFSRVLRVIFNRVRTSEETHLRLLLTKQRKQVDEIKKATNYDSTRKLIEQYDEANRGHGPATPMRQPPQQQQQQQQQQRNPATPIRKAPDSPSPDPRASGDPRAVAGTPRAPGHLVGAGGTPAGQAATPGLDSPFVVPQGMSAEQAAFLQSQMQSIQPILPPPEKKWYDRVADTILGDDPSQNPNNKYALVCAECFRHNGLVGSKYEWERMQWICPRCNHMNPSPLSRMQEEFSADPGPETPSKPATLSAPSPMSPSLTPGHLRASPRPRRQIGERPTPRSSRLSTEVYNSSDKDDEDEDEQGTGEDEDDAMEVDK